MKHFPAYFFILLMMSCGKIEHSQEIVEEENSSIPPYDTVAIDSFSQGANSVNIARQIQMSSQKYQDSLKEVRTKLEAEKILKKDVEEKEKAAKKLEEDRKKTEESKLKKEKEKAQLEIPAAENKPNP